MSPMKDHPFVLSRITSSSRRRISMTDTYVHTYKRRRSRRTALATRWRPCERTGRLHGVQCRGSNHDASLVCPLSPLLLRN